MLLLATVGVGVALTLASVLLKRRRRRLTEGDALASLLSGFGFSLATIKGLVPITWTVVVWATTSQFVLMPGTSMTTCCWPWRSGHSQPWQSPWSLTSTACSSGGENPTSLSSS